MAKAKHRKERKKIRVPSIPVGPPQSSKATYDQEQRRGNLLVTEEFHKALDECKTRVEKIAKECRKQNRKFRDVEFDLENDLERCLYSLQGIEGTDFKRPSDTRRVTQIFDKPSFFVDGANSSDIVQGDLGDCYLLSALATMSTMEGLVEKFCVAMDEVVGIYGFIFFRNAAWVVVIIDDLLYMSIPKFEELSLEKKALYHHDQNKYNKLARKGNQSLCFARSGMEPGGEDPGETWVPLIEKAYAKLYGSYAALDVGGQAGEAIEDLTGGVTTFISTKDILDRDTFWDEELLKANGDRLFGCSYDELDNSNTYSDETLTVNGLMGNHAYSVLRAIEYRGKRFVVVRNPWGKSEWTGPWSDGSSEWNEEWLPALAKLRHQFGNDGQFVMEYNDFLENWEQIDRTLLFDETWVMSSHWLKVTARPLPSAWRYGDVSFTFSIPEDTPAVIVLSNLDDRSFSAISGSASWAFSFVVFRKGEIDPIATSSMSLRSPRSINAEVDHLISGDYIVHVRLDRYTVSDDSDRDLRTLSRVLTEKIKSQTIASNFNKSLSAKFLPIPLETLAGQDLAELEAKAVAATKAQADQDQAILSDVPAPALAPQEPAGTLPDAVEHIEVREAHGLNRAAPRGPTNTGHRGPTEEDSDDDSESSHGIKENEKLDQAPDKTSYQDMMEFAVEEDVIFLGLRVYTKKESPAKVGGQLRHEMDIPFDGLAIQGL